MWLHGLATWMLMDYLDLASNCWQLPIRLAGVRGQSACKATSETHRVAGNEKSLDQAGIGLHLLQVWALRKRSRGVIIAWDFGQRLGASAEGPIINGSTCNHKLTYIKNYRR